MQCRRLQTWNELEAAAAPKGGEIIKNFYRVNLTSVEFMLFVELPKLLLFDFCVK